MTGDFFTPKPQLSVIYTCSCMRNLLEHGYVFLYTIPSLRIWTSNPRLSCERAEVGVQGEAQTMILDERTPLVCGEQYDIKQLKYIERRLGVSGRHRETVKKCVEGRIIAPN